MTRVPLPKSELRHGNVSGLLRYVVAPLNGRTLCNRLVPALRVRVLLKIDSLPLEARDPGPDRDVGNGVSVCHERVLGQTAVQDAIPTAPPMARFTWTPRTPALSNSSR